MRSRDDRTIVAILAMPRAYSLDVSIPAHVFGRHPGYRVLVCGDQELGADDDASGRPLGVDVAADIRPTHSLSDVEYADIVVVPGYENPSLPIPDGYLKAVRLAGERGARMVAVCTGVFALAATGMLDGKTATTHWQYTDRLRTTYPEVEVAENRLFVEVGAILTSAGAGSGIDACLHVIQSDFGTTVADDVTKEVVSSAARGANEPQYMDVPSPPRAGLQATREWVIDNIGSSITVQRMADHSRLSRRTFIRHFVRETGMPPMHWVAGQRILGARRLLESSDWSVERIAGATGFGTAANFRNIFRREVGVTPTAYRKSHGPSSSDDDSVSPPTVRL
ncbi:helix-turn-helix domain-containing protein [Streptomyces phaeochromogenes]|uniref:GlxA family transcriptional regulator n=1 Tax=Streptomyces phaeochromogenes TaxID=1923 RepID=UPI0033F01C66